MIECVHSSAVGAAQIPHAADTAERCLYTTCSQIASGSFAINITITHIGPLFLAGCHKVNKCNDVSLT